MKAKTIIRIALLAVVAVALGDWALDTMRERSVAADSAPAVTRADGVTVISFHGTKRCRTCLKIGTMAKLTVDENFTEAKPLWDEIDYERAEHAHYVGRYGLVSSTVVATLWKGGKEIVWEELDDVWEHVGDEAVFRAYLVQGVRELQEKHGR